MAMINQPATDLTKARYGRLLPEVRRQYLTLGGCA